MAAHKILIIKNTRLSDIGQHLAAEFDSDCENNFEVLAGLLEKGDYKAIIYDCLADEVVNHKGLTDLLALDAKSDVPVLVMGKAASVQDKLDALEVGADDFIEPHVDRQEACVRVTKSIFHRVAAVQLESRLHLASQTAHTAMLDNSDLGANIQFLLSVHDCENLDQLGQLFFTTIERYGLKCSLQLRGDNEIKNMEAHGMAKDLESQLLTQLRGGDRYIDFGSRTIVNYERVSLLIKNMPVNDPDKYGAIKDNTFSLIQGMNARVIALDDHAHLIEEWETMTKLASDVRRVMETIQSSYQKVIRDIAAEVDTASEQLSMKLPSFSLMEEDEAFIEETMADCVKNTTQIFNVGLKVDEEIQRLENTIDRSLEAIQSPQKPTEDVKPSMEEKSGASASQAAVELF